MNLIRLIAIAVLFWLLYRLILALLRNAGRIRSRTVMPPHEEEVVRCARCGVHIPQGEALEKGGQFYCCPEHRDAADSWRRDDE